MITVITGDVIKSSGLEPDQWLTPLKNALAIIQPDPRYREIFRGDSFQLELHDNTKAFEAVIYIKACIKMIRGLDIRLAIGIGDKSYEGDNITESNGEAFIYSGETLEVLKKEKQNIKIKTADDEFNAAFNLYFKLVLIAMDSWTMNSAEVVKWHLEYPQMRQKDMSKRIGISQNTVSERRKRAHLDEILELNAMFKLKINQLA